MEEVSPRRAESQLGPKTMRQPTQQFKRIATVAAASGTKAPDSKSLAPKAKPQVGSGRQTNPIGLPERPKTRL